MRGSVLGLRAGQIAVWPPAAIALGYGWEHPGTAFGTGLVAGGGVVFAATLARFGHRWGYQWAALATTRRRRPVRRADILPDPPDARIAALRAALLPELRIPSAGPPRSKIGVIEDGGSWAAVIAVAHGPSGGAPLDILPGALAPVLRGEEIELSAVQVLVHTVPAAPGATARPRSELVRVALRVDPRAAGPGSETLRVPSFQRMLRLRARRVVELLTEAGLEARIMDAERARAALLADAAIEPAAPPPRQGWRWWSSGRHRHIVYWAKRWPRAGMAELQRGLAAVPAHGTVLSVTLAPAPHGAVSTTALLRVITADGRRPARDARRAVRAGARAAGARLIPLTGEQHRGVLATLPLARELSGPVVWRGAHRAGTEPGTALRTVGGGLPLGRDDTGGVVLLPMFQEEPRHFTVLADARLAGVLALRALRSGAGVCVTAADDAVWSRVQRGAGRAAERLHLTPPGQAGPAEGTCLRPWLVFTEGAPAAVTPRSWCSTVEFRAEGGAGSLGPKDTAVVHRPAGSTVDALAQAFRLPRRAAFELRMLPPNAVALVRRGEVRVVDLALADNERELLGL
ncbi:type VII secretion protein EccE [Actinomadura sp. 6N118]|uniref:type VII secretion protein EccE n=1 Tax=Actinomadura sp. 6N118 TaxID=3375151 RepID=UPI0037B42B5D